MRGAGKAPGEAQAAILLCAKTVSHRVGQTETAPGNLQPAIAIYWGCWRQATLRAALKRMERQAERGTE